MEKEMEKPTNEQRLNEVLVEIDTITASLEKDGTDRDTAQGRMRDLLAEGEDIRKSIEAERAVKNMRSLLDEPQGPQNVIIRSYHKSIGDQFIEWAEYRERVKSGKLRGTHLEFEAKGHYFPAERKATFDTTATGLDGTVNYLPRGVDIVPQQPPRIRDLMPVGTTTMNAVPYVAETSFTNAAATVAEGGTKPDATLATDDKISPVRKIAVRIKVTDEVFADFPMMRDYVNGRLMYMVQNREDVQLISGTGVAPQITGFLNVAGIQSQPKGADTVADAIAKAIVKVQSVGFTEPDAIVINPTDWQGLRLTKDLNGQYYSGGPFVGSYGVGGIAGLGLWGYPVVVTSSIAAGTVLVGAFRTGAQIWQRDGIRVEAFDQNENDAINNLIMVRVEERLALTVYQPLAFCKVTGL